jgi:hypothetical protein
MLTGGKRSTGMEVMAATPTTTTIMQAIRIKKG